MGNPKAANIFKKEVKPKALPVGSPGIKEIYCFFQENRPSIQKNKTQHKEELMGSSKTTGESESESDTGEEDSDENDESKLSTNQTTVTMKEVDEDSDSEESEEETLSQTTVDPSKTGINGADKDDSESDSSEDETEGASAKKE